MAEHDHPVGPHVHGGLSVLLAGVKIYSRFVVGGRRTRSRGGPGARRWRRRCCRVERIGKNGEDIGGVDGRSQRYTDKIY